MADVVSTGDVFSSTDLQHEIWPVAAATARGTALISIADQPAVVIATGSGTNTETVGPYTITGPSVDVGLDALEVSVATDGTYDFVVAGGLTTTPQNTLVYAVVASGLITSLTLTASTNKKFGKVNYQKGRNRVAGTLPVKIGVFA